MENIRLYVSKHIILPNKNRDVNLVSTNSPLKTFDSSPNNLFKYKTLELFFRKVQS